MKHLRPFLLVIAIAVGPIALSSCAEGVGGMGGDAGAGSGGSAGAAGAGSGGASATGGTSGGGGSATGGSGAGGTKGSGGFGTGGTGGKAGGSGSGGSASGGSGAGGTNGSGGSGAGGATGSGGSSSSSLYRVVISSDFPPTNVCNIRGGCSCPASQCSDPDDVQSMVRFLLYTNELDVEALIASSGTFAGVARKQNILDMIALYEQVYANLKKHDVRYPTPDRLRGITHQGRDGTWGQAWTKILGDGMDSEASNAIIAIVDKPDPRPVWFSVWGGPRELAQAIWKVKATRTAAELKAFLGKMRVFAIADQDGSNAWMKDNFPDLFYINSLASTYGGMFCSGDTSLCNVAWLNANLRQGHGPLGAVYPPAASACDGVMEGDTPSFFHLISANRGINDPEKPDQNGWGGKYSRVGTTNHWGDCCGGSTISKFRADFQKEFAARADRMLP